MSSSFLDGGPLPYIYSMDANDSMDKPVEAVIKGTVPGWLKGSLFRNGSGVYRIGDTTYKHLFDGFAVVHRWTIQDGRVTYLGKILNSDIYQRCVAMDRIVGGSVGTTFPDPCKSIFRRFFSSFLPMLPEKSTDNTCVNIVEQGDRLFTLTETTVINEIDPETLQRTSRSDAKDVFALHLGTAHPHFEKDGTMLYYGTNMNCKKAYNIVKAKPPKDNEAPMENAYIVATIPSRWKANISYNHSFGVSENYIVVLELPFAINLAKLLAPSVTQRPFAEILTAYPEEKMLIHVVEKKTGHHHPVTFRAPHGFVFHFINCFEEEGHLVVDVCLADHAEIDYLYLDRLMDPNAVSNMAGFARFVLPLNIEGAHVGQNVNHLPDSQAKATLVSDTIVDVEAERPFDPNLYWDLPRINYERHSGVKYRYVYGSTVVTKCPVKKVLKFDLLNKTVKEWSCGDGYEPAEPIFIQKPGSDVEDEGIILCPIISTKAESESFLLILDAMSFEELATASIPKEIKTNLTFHGTFTSKVY